MKTKFRLTVAIWMIAFSMAHAQENYSKPNYLEVYFSGGGLTYFAPVLKLEDARLLAPQSTILSTDLSRFTRAYGSPSNGSYMGDAQSYHSPVNASFLAGAVFEAQVGTYGFGRSESRKRSPQLRLGISYGATQNVGTYWYNEDVTPYDTLVSTKNGGVVYTDSVHYESLEIIHSSSEVRVSADILFHTQPDRRFSVYIGAGINGGATFNNQTQVYYFNKSYIKNRNEGTGYSDQSGSSYSTNEWYNNKAGWMLGAYIPLGFSLRLAKETAVLNQMSLYFEMRSGLTAYAIPELQTYLLPYFQGNFGLRVRF